MHARVETVKESARVANSQPVIGVVGVNVRVRLLAVPSILAEKAPVRIGKLLAWVLVTDILLIVLLYRETVGV